jgi:UDP-N-acetylbacillosamine N-acetyltransferase
MPLSRPRIIIWGASGHAEVVADVIRLQDQFEILGFLDDLHPQRHGQFFCGAQILGGAENLNQLDPKSDRVIVAIGNCNTRLALAARIRREGLDLATAVHPRATVAQGVTIGPGSVVAAGAVVNPGVTLGENVIINTCASVDHHCRIGDGCHIAPGAHLAGNVRTGRAVWIGLGALIVQERSIGDESVIGAGAVVLKDIPGGVVAYGVPAKIVRKVSPADAQ